MRLWTLSVPSGERIFLFYRNFQNQCKKASIPWLVSEEKIFSQNLNFCRCRDLPVERYKNSSFIATFAVSRGLSMKGKKI